jgi:proto-chlorophyllide reductase subunit
MKFLCVPCDQPMKVLSVTPPDRGSISVTYGCPACGYEMAMLTNPIETQLVSSLGVKVGPAATASDTAKCPFSGMVAAAEPPAADDGIRWTAEAAARMQAIPDFVRPMAKIGIERFARESGHEEITVAVLDEAKSRFGM